MSFMTYVATWVAIGIFTAWIARNVEKPGQHGVIANVPVAVLGALLAGFAVRGLLAGPLRFNLFLASAVAAQVVSAAFVALGDIGLQQHLNQHHTNPHRHAP